MRRLSGVAAARVRALGLEETSPGILGYAADYAPPRLALEKLIMVPHGRTPSNERMLFQSHAEGPNATLLPSSLDEAARGAEAFLAEHGARYAASPAEFRFSRSPLRRCVETAAVYLDAFEKRGLARPEVAVDEGLLEIDHASWHGLTVAEISAGPERDAAAKYRAGDFFAKPRDGESNVDVIERARAWLDGALPKERVVYVAFGHGTFQNAAEVSLRVFRRKTPAEVFSRQPGRSHLRRGWPHVLYDADAQG